MPVTKIRPAGAVVDLGDGAGLVELPLPPVGPPGTPGLLSVASQAAAEAGTDNFTGMTPLRSEQHADAWALRHAGQWELHPSGSLLATDPPPDGIAKFLRVPGRIIVGAAAADYGGSHREDEGMTWLGDPGAGSGVSLSYIERSANVHVVSKTGGVALSGASRTSDKYAFWNAEVWTSGEVIVAGDLRGYSGHYYEALNGGTTAVGQVPVHTSGDVTGSDSITWRFRNFTYHTPIAGSFVAVSDINDGEGTWPIYGEGIKVVGGGSVFSEIHAANYGSQVATSPYSRFGTAGGATIALYIPGGGSDITAATTPSSAAIHIGGPKDTWLKGLIFDAVGLEGTDGVTGTGTAIMPARGQNFIWQTPEATTGFTINSTVDDTDGRVGIVADDDSIAFTRVGVNMVHFTTDAGASAVANSFEFIAKVTGSAPVLRPSGDTNVGIIIRGRGSDGGHLQNGSSQTVVQWDGVGAVRRLAFFDGTPVVQQTGVGAALSTGGAETNTNLATRINQIRTLLLNYGLAA